MINMFIALLIAEAFPDISKMKAYVASGAGYLQGGLQRENWERGTSQLSSTLYLKLTPDFLTCQFLSSLLLATLSIVKMTSLVTLHPGINFLIKHVGTIFRKLFQV